MGGIVGCGRVSLVVALDTSTEYVAIGVADVDHGTGQARMLAEETFLAPRRANAVALPELRDLLARGGVAPSSITLVVAGRGPGSFTGVRIGLATAKGIAQGLGVPLVAASTLDAIARGSVARAGVLGVVGDAMRQEVYPMRYRSDGDTVTRIDPGHTVARPADVAAAWEAAGPDRPDALLGNGLARYADLFAAVLGAGVAQLNESTWAPTAAGLLAVAKRDMVSAFAEPERFDPAIALPIYTRLSDAEEAEAARMLADGAPGVPDSGVVGPVEGGDA